MLACASAARLDATLQPAPVARVMKPLCAACSAAEAVLARADAALPGCSAPALAAARLSIGHARALAHGDLAKVSWPPAAAGLTSLPAPHTTAPAPPVKCVDVDHLTRCEPVAGFQRDQGALLQVWMRCHRAGCL